MGTSSRDLLQKFVDSATISDLPPAEEVELCLGLSLGGCFGSGTPRERTKLIRSSSISSFPFFAGDSKNSPPPETSEKSEKPAPAPSLFRTCSLPVAGVEEDYRKRKEVQSLKRLEAKRKRSEKRNASGSSKADELGEGCPWPPGSGRTAARFQQGSSSGSSGSVDVRPMQGLDFSKFSDSPEAKSPTSPVNPNQQPLKTIERRVSWTGEMERSMMQEMPCVSTRGDGPNGRKIQGFLYKYRKGEDVRIVCVCHGSFLTPAEFVRHAGGGNVDHPLRHIVVSPPSPST